MGLKYDIINVNINEISNDEARRLCIAYRVNLDQNLASNRVADCRTKLEIVQKNYIWASRDVSYEKILKNVVVDRFLSDENKIKYPALFDLYAITEGLYDEVYSENTNSGMFRSTLTISPSSSGQYVNTVLQKEQSTAVSGAIRSHVTLSPPNARNSNQVSRDFN